MTPSIRIELHCHSSFSDGVLSPESVAQRLHQRGVRYAALTDHDTLEGVAPFRAECRRLGIGTVSGIELTTFFETRPVHILGYGFDTANSELLSVLPALRPPPNVAASNFPPQRELSSAEGIALVHRAGGIACLAHPFITEPDHNQRIRLLDELKASGLDGVEFFRTDDPPGERDRLREAAESRGLLLCGGTDHHFHAETDTIEPGIDMPAAAWEALRSTLFATAQKYHQAGGRAETPPPAPPGASRPSRLFFVKQVVLPAILALCLFAGVLLFAVVPAFEQALLDRKREMIRELTNTAWSVLAEARREEQEGVLTPAQARAQAVKRVAAMRYGSDAKDYFWIQDTQPEMVMHPYRTDLNGTDLSGFTDPRGVRIFVAFTELAKSRHEGYVHYVWQWKDDPARLEPKESYIRLFEPWGWIIGTGLYTHDVQSEIQRLQVRLMLFSSGIFILVAFLLVYMLRSTLRIEQKRSEAEGLLRETTDRYKTLVHAATEGMLYCNGPRCLYGNPMVLELTGYRQEDLELMEVSDLLPDVPGNAAILSFLQNPGSGFTAAPVSGLIRAMNGTLLECSMTLRPTGSQHMSGYLLLMRRVAKPGTAPAAAPRGFLGDLLRLPASIARDIREEIQKVDTAPEVATLCSDAAKLVRSLLDNGASALEITKMLSSITDAATCRLIDIAIDRFGKPPVPFAFIALGSQGRLEQTLLTDQDNAIIMGGDAATDRADIQEYFQNLADFICAGLSASGYRHCKGKVMASNPRWCRSLGVWKEYFNEWISRADQQELMEFSIFFDFRFVYGEESLVRDLRTHVGRRAMHSTPFFAQAAQNALAFKSPMRLFGIVVSAPGKGESANQIDLKSAAMPIISFARLYCLKQGLFENNTGARIAELVRSGVLLPSRQEEIMSAYSLLLRLRLRNQVGIMEAGGEPDNMVDPSKLGHIERAILRECFNEIDLLQSQIRRDFLGEV